MNRGEFIHEVQRRGNLNTTDEAETATLATLSVLGERLKGGEPKDLAAQLPGDLADAVASAGPGERFEIKEFYRRIAEREEPPCTPDQARSHARVVMEVLFDAISEGERDDVLAQLPQEYRSELVS